MGIRIDHNFGGAAIEAGYHEGRGRAADRRRKYALGMLTNRRRSPTTLGSRQRSTSKYSQATQPEGRWSDPAAGLTGQPLLQIEAQQNTNARDLRMGNDISYPGARPQFQPAPDMDMREGLFNTELPEIPEHASPEDRQRLGKLGSALRELRHGDQWDHSDDQLRDKYLSTLDEYHAGVAAIPARNPNQGGLIFDDEVGYRPVGPGERATHWDMGPGKQPAVTDDYTAQLQGQKEAAAQAAAAQKAAAAEMEKRQSEVQSLEDALQDLKKEQADDDQSRDEDSATGKARRAYYNTKRQQLLQRYGAASKALREAQAGAQPTSPAGSATSPSGASSPAAAPAGGAPVDAHGNGPVDMLLTDPPTYIMADGSRVKGKGGPSPSIPLAGPQTSGDMARDQMGEPLPNIYDPGAVGGQAGGSGPAYPQPGERTSQEGIPIPEGVLPESEKRYTAMVKQRDKYPEGHPRRKYAEQELRLLAGGRGVRSGDPLAAGRAEQASGGLVSTTGGQPAAPGQEAAAPIPEFSNELRVPDDVAQMEGTPEGAAIRGAGDRMRAKYDRIRQHPAYGKLVEKYGEDVVKRVLAKRGLGTGNPNYNADEDQEYADALARGERQAQPKVAQGQAIRDDIRSQAQHDRARAPAHLAKTVAKAEAAAKRLGAAPRADQAPGTHSDLGGAQVTKYGGASEYDQELKLAKGGSKAARNLRDKGYVYDKEAGGWRKPPEFAGSNEELAQREAAARREEEGLAALAARRSPVTPVSGTMPPASPAQGEADPQSVPGARAVEARKQAEASPGKPVKMTHPETGEVWTITKDPKTGKLTRVKDPKDYDPKTGKGLSKGDMFIAPDGSLRKF